MVIQPANNGDVPLVEVGNFIPTNGCGFVHNQVMAWPWPVAWRATDSLGWWEEHMWARCFQM